jgi:hypothetical protein
MLNRTQVPDASMPCLSVPADERAQCPICLLYTTRLPSRTSLSKHLASHLERFSLNCLPLGADFWGGENLRSDDSSESTGDGLDELEDRGLDAYDRGLEEKEREERQKEEQQEREIFMREYVRETVIQEEGKKLEREVGKEDGSDNEEETDDDEPFIFQEDGIL